MDVGAAQVAAQPLGPHPVPGAAAPQPPVDEGDPDARVALAVPSGVTVIFAAEWLPFRNSRPRGRGARDAATRYEARGRTLRGGRDEGRTMDFKFLLMVRGVVIVLAVLLGGHGRARPVLRPARPGGVAGAVVLAVLAWLGRTLDKDGR